MPEVRVGISGWVYKPWRGVFYPSGLRRADELAYASEHVTSIEVNGSFSSLQAPASWRRWCDATPDGFVFAVKGPRFITHLRRLGDVATPLAFDNDIKVRAPFDAMGLIERLPRPPGFPPQPA